MPNLPSISVTDPQLAKITEAFTDAAGYRSWLKTAVRDEALRRQAVVLTEAANTSVRDALMAVEAELPSLDPPADPPPDPPA